MLIRTQDLIERCKILPAFNFSTPEMARAIVRGCDELQVPAVLQTSQSEAKFLSFEVAASVASSFAKISKVDFALQLDHLRDLNLLAKYDLLALGYSSVMVDVEGSDYSNSVQKVSDVKESYPELFLEANLEFYDRAKEFVSGTNVDLLAPERKNHFDLLALADIIKKVKVPLVAHGCSSSSDEEIKKALSLGVKKFNFNTCLRQSWASALRATLEENPNFEKPYNILEPSEEAVYETVKEKLKLLGFS